MLICGIIANCCEESEIKHLKAIIMLHLLAFLKRMYFNFWSIINYRHRDSNVATLLKQWLCETFSRCQISSGTAMVVRKKIYVQINIYLSADHNGRLTYFRICRNDEWRSWKPRISRINTIIIMKSTSLWKL